MESKRWGSTDEDGKASLHQVDGAFFNKIITRNPSMDVRNQVFDSIATIPFNWESQPGLPRENLLMNEIIPPINLPPALHGSYRLKRNITHTQSRVSMIKKMKKIRREIKDQAKHLSAKANRYLAKAATTNKVCYKDNQGSSRPTDEFFVDESDDVFAGFTPNSGSSSRCSSTLKPSRGGMQLCKLPRLPKTKVRSTLVGMAGIFARLSLKKTS